MSADWAAAALTPDGERARLLEEERRARAPWAGASAANREPLALPSRRAVWRFECEPAVQQIEGLIWVSGRRNSAKRTSVYADIRRLARGHMATSYGRTARRRLPPVIRRMHLCEQDLIRSPSQHFQVLGHFKVFVTQPCMFLLGRFTAQVR